MKPDNRRELMKLHIKRSLLRNYGNNLVLSGLKETKPDLFDVEISYSKIFHIKDERKNTIFVRSIKIDRVFGGQFKSGEEIKLPLDEINSKIRSEHDIIKKNIIRKVLSEKRKRSTKFS